MFYCVVLLLSDLGVGVDTALRLCTILLCFDLLYFIVVYYSVILCWCWC